MGQTASVKKSTPNHGRRKAMAAAVALPIAAALALTGCSAGQITQTAVLRSAVDGATADLGSIHVRNATIAAPTSAHSYAKGATLDLEMTIINDSDADELTAATVAGVGATLEGSNASSSSGARNSESVGSGASSITIPAQRLVAIGDQNTITISESSEELFPSQLVPVVLTFKNAGELKFDIPVGVPLTEAPKVKGDQVDLHENPQPGEVD